MDLASRAYILLGFIVLLGVLAGGILYAGKKIQERNNQGGSFGDLDEPVKKAKKPRASKEKKPKTVKPSRREKKAQADAGVLPLSSSAPAAAPAGPMRVPAPTPVSPPPSAAPHLPSAPVAVPAPTPKPPAQTSPPRTTGSPFSPHEETDSEW